MIDMQNPLSISDATWEKVMILGQEILRPRDFPAGLWIETMNDLASGHHQESYDEGWEASKAHHEDTISEKETKIENLYEKIDDLKDEATSLANELENAEIEIERLEDRIKFLEGREI